RPDHYRADIAKSTIPGNLTFDVNSDHRDGGTARSAKRRVDISDHTRGRLFVHTVETRQRFRRGVVRRYAVAKPIGNHDREPPVAHGPSPLVSTDLFAGMRHENRSDLIQRLPRRRRRRLRPETRHRHGAGWPRIDLKEI